jgi:hypothetical protein
MADSPVSICSNALRRIGANPITALTEDSDRARLCSAFYPVTLRRLQRSHNWNFTTVRVGLVELSTAPSWGYLHQYAIPTDPACLFVRETSLEDTEPWELELYTSGSVTQRVLVTDASSVAIVYQALVTDTTLFDDQFSYLFETDLAWQLCYPITRNAQLLGEIAKELNDARLKSRSRDGQESRSLKKFQSDELTRLR